MPQSEVVDRTPLSIECEQCVYTLSGTGSARAFHSLRLPSDNSSGKHFALPSVHFRVGRFFSIMCRYLQ